MWLGVGLAGGAVIGFVSNGHRHRRSLVAGASSALPADGVTSELWRDVRAAMLGAVAWKVTEATGHAIPGVRGNINRTGRGTSNPTSTGLS
jgi:hypothetical protein